MSLKNITKIFILISIFSFILSCSKTSKSSSSDSISYLTGGAGDWVLKIDNLTINQTNFNKDLSASMLYQGANEEQIALAKNDNATKQYYAEMLTRDILLLKKAEADKFFETEESKDILNAMIRSLKAQYYLQNLLIEASKSVPEPSAEQAKAFFEQAKPQLAQYGITEYNIQTAPAIAQFYKQTFAQQTVERQIMDLKDAAVIERNDAILGQLGVPPQTIQQPTENDSLLPRDTN